MGTAANTPTRVVAHKQRLSCGANTTTVDDGNVFTNEEQQVFILQSLSPSAYLNHPDINL